MPAGRPSKYTPELLEQAYAYLDEWETLGQLIPSNEGLSYYLGVGKRTIYDWAKDEEKQEFSHILDKIQAQQAQLVLNKGLGGDFNPSIAKLVLGKHGYHDKHDIEHAGDITHKHEGISRSLELLGEFRGSGSNQLDADPVSD